MIIWQASYPKNDWKDLLNKNIKDEIETSFKNEMQDLGYL